MIAPSSSQVREESHSGTSNARRRVFSSRSRRALVTFSADATRLAAVDEHQMITVWDLQTGKPLAELPASEGDGLRLALSADGRALAAGRDRVVVWDLGDVGRQPVNALEKVAVISLAFSTDGETLAIGSVDQGIVQWDYRRRRQRWPLQSPRNGARSLAFSPDGTVLVVDGGLGAVWLLRPSRQHEQILQRKVDVELLAEGSAHDGRMLALKRGTGYVLWDSSGTRQPIALADLPEQQIAIRLSPRGNVLAVLDEQRRIRLWNTDTGKPIWDIATPVSSLERIDVSSEGDLVAAVSSDGDVVVADSRTGSTWSASAAATDLARSIAFSSDGRRLASGGLEGAIHVWDAQRRTRLFTLQNSTTNVLALAFSSDGHVWPQAIGAASSCGTWARKPSGGRCAARDWPSPTLRFHRTACCSSRAAWTDRP
jgi:WD40 repeat protein